MATFATRDQENLIRGWETAAAGAKTVGKGGINQKLAPKTPGKINAFTPAPPRTNRAPLGAKTSNVKATAFKTPAPLTGGAALQKTQRRSASGKKPKLKIHQPEVVELKPELEDEEEEPEIEFCPAPIKPLADTLDDDEVIFRDGVDYSWVKDAQYAGTFSHELHGIIGEDGLSKYQRSRKQAREYDEASIDAIFLTSIDESLNPEDRTPEMLAATKAAIARRDELDQKYFNGKMGKSANTDPKKHQTPKPSYPTMNAKSAASALNSKPLPRFAAPTLAAKARQAGSYAQEQDAPVKKNPLQPANVLASRSTIGYSKGRKVSSTLRKDQPSDTPVKLNPAKEPELDKQDESDRRRQDLLDSLTALQDDDEDDGSDPLQWQEDSHPLGDWFAQQMEGFRLTLPDDVPEEED